MLKGNTGGQKPALFSLSPSSLHYSQSVPLIPLSSPGSVLWEGALRRMRPMADALAVLRRCSQLVLLHKMSFVSQALFGFCLLLEEIILLNNDLPCARTSVFKEVCGAACLLTSVPAAVS